MMDTVLVKSYSAPPVNIREVFRYAVGEASDSVVALLSECMKEADEGLVYKVCYGVFSYDGISSSRDLKKTLTGCNKVIAFAATVGVSLDRLIMKYSRISPVRALLLQAYGAERIEALCDSFCRDMAEEWGMLTPRFSPGYGDLSIEVQRDIFRVLDCPKKIGLSLNESLLMTPTKSVTAIVGIKDEL